MRRLLSWVSLIVCTQIFYYVQYYFWYFVQYIFNLSYSAGKVLFWVLIFLGGSTVFGILISMLSYGPLLSIRLSQLIWKSKKGLRYYVLGAFQIIFYLIYLILYRKGILITDNSFLLLTSIFTTIIFHVVLIILSKQIVAGDGLPPTKKEILQAKLSKIEESENKTEV